MVIAQGSIGSKAFANCTSLRYADLGNVSSIADDAFSGSNVTIITNQGSYADTWARNHNVAVEYR